jgi:DNA-binding response OmpR family regulator
MKSQSSQGVVNTKPRVRDVLVVDADPKTGETFSAGGTDVISIRNADSIEQASLALKHKAADVVVVNLQINDNAGLELLARVRQGFPQTETVALTRVANPELCLTALRAGVSDMLVGPVNVLEAQACLARVAQRRTRREALAARNQRLRVVCRQLNKARHEISQQVNLLCHDLVKAYQDLAEQLNQTQVTGEFSVAVGEEVEIETLMRRTMEWMLKKLGPVNAAVFLPDSEHNYTLGAYLNFDTNADSMLMDVIAQTIVPQAAQATGPLLIETDRQVFDHFGDEANMLVGRAWLVCGAFYQNECLAVVVVFRGQGEPFDPTWAPLLESVAPILADKIAKAIRVYQRHISDHDSIDETDGPPDADADDHDLTA